MKLCKFTKKFSFSDHVLTAGSAYIVEKFLLI
jgi:hypothetical protein